MGEWPRALRRAGGSRQPGDPASRLHPDRPRRGSPWSSGWATSTPSPLVDAPGHGRSADVSADLWEGAELLAARPVGGRPTSATPSAGGSRCTWPCAHPELVDSLVLVGATAGIDSAEDAPGPPGRRRGPGPTGSRPRAWPPSSDWWLERPAVRHPASRGGRRREPPDQHRGRAGGQPAPGRHRRSGAAVGSDGGARDAGPGRRRASSTTSSRPSGRRLAAAIGRQRRAGPSSPAPGTPAISSGPMPSA